MAKKKSAPKIPPDMRASMLYSATRPKSICVCTHTGDGGAGQHGGFGGHGACLATPMDGRSECECGKFTWKGLTPEYKAFVAKQRARLSKRVKSI